MPSESSDGLFIFLCRLRVLSTPGYELLLMPVRELRFHTMIDLVDLLRTSDVSLFVALPLT